MGVIDDSASAVLGALGDLRDVLNVPEMHANGGLRADDRELRDAWTKLDRAIRGAAGVIANPQPGQGLVLIWLRAVCTKAAIAEKAVVQHPRGWQDVVLHDDNHLLWLVTHGFQYGYQLLKRAGTGSAKLASLLEPQRRPLEELRQLAEVWSVESNDVPDEQQAAQNRSAPFRRGGHEFLQEAGELLLQAVDAVEVSTDFLEGDDSCDHFLKHIDSPDVVVRLHLTEVSGDGLLALVDSLTPREVHLVNDEPQRRPMQDPTPTESYPSPRLYARDKWIYENIEAHDCHSLSLKLKKKARGEKWEIISSRNGLKKAADRYAIYHSLPLRRSGNARTSG